MFIKPEMAETTGISEIGISFAEDFPPSLEINTIDFDSFLIYQKFLPIHSV